MFEKFRFKFHRGKIFVNPKAQGKLLLRFAGYWFVYHFVLIHTLLIFEFVRTRIEMMNSGIHTPFGEMYGAFWGKYLPLAVSAVMLLPFLLYDVVKSTHRIVGPLVRFQNTFKKLRAGEHVERVKLREQDLLSDFEKDFNAFLEHYNEIVASKTETVSSAEERILAAVEALHSEANPQAASPSREEGRIPEQTASV